MMVTRWLVLAGWPQRECQSGLYQRSRTPGQHPIRGLTCPSRSSLLSCFLEGCLLAPLYRPLVASPAVTSSGSCGRPHHPSALRTRRTWSPAVTSDEHCGRAQHVLSRTGHRTDPELILNGLRGLSCLRIEGSMHTALDEPGQIQTDRHISDQITAPSPRLSVSSPAHHAQFPRLCFPWKACLRAFAWVIFSTWNALP